MGDVQGGDGESLGAGSRDASSDGPATLREVAGMVFVLVTLIVAWGASAVLLRLLLRTTWPVSLAAAPALLLVLLVVRNAFRHRRRLRPQRG